MVNEVKWSEVGTTVSVTIVPASLAVEVVSMDAQALWTCKIIKLVDPEYLVVSQIVLSLELEESLGSDDKVALQSDQS